MRIRDKADHSEDPPNLMPLIDMVFLLLIFFLVATTFAEEERNQNITLTRASANESLSSTPNQLIVNITAEGKKEIAGKLYDDKQLEELLTREVQDNPDRKVLLRCDANAYHKFFNQTAVLCQKTGIERVNIGYIPQETKE
ncbi:MAG: ExbD/TolR family protein [Phycisphaerae bacterium]